MKTLVLWLLVILGLFVIVLPAVRCVFKRLSCAARLSSLCRKHGLTLHGAHPLWFLGTRFSRVLVFRETGEYFFRRYSNILMIIFDAFDGAFRPLPEYDFSRAERFAAGKPRRDVLLLCPIPMEIRIQPHSGQETVTGPGDTLFGMELASLSHLLRVVENAAEQPSN